MNVCNSDSPIHYRLDFLLYLIPNALMSKILTGPRILGSHTCSKLRNGRNGIFSFTQWSARSFDDCGLILTCSEYLEVTSFGKYDRAHEKNICGTGCGHLLPRISLMKTDWAKSTRTSLTPSPQKKMIWSKSFKVGFHMKRNLLPAADQLEAQRKALGL